MALAFRPGWKPPTPFRWKLLDQMSEGKEQNPDEPAPSENEPPLMGISANVASTSASVESKKQMDSPEVRIKRRADYSRLVRTARLTSILLEKNDFSVRSEAVGISKALLKRELSANASALATGGADNICIAKVDWTVKYTYERRLIVKCVSTYIVSFEGMKEFSEDIVNIYVDTNAKAMTYSYFRALYAHLDWGANLGSAPLPIVQFQAKV